MVGVDSIVYVDSLVMRMFPYFTGWRGEMRRFKSLTKKSILLVVVTALVLTALSHRAWAQANETDKQKVVQKVAENWIQVGIRQYERGFFKASEQSLLRAGDYRQYLTAARRKELNELLEKARKAVLENKRVLARIRTANELVGRGKLVEAKSCFDEVKDSQFLTEDKRKQIADELKKINGQLSGQKKEIVSLYDRSQADPQATPQAEPEEKVSEAFVKVVDDELIGAEMAVEKADQQKPRQPDRSDIVDVSETTDDKAGYIEVINRRRNILRSHTRAVVNDTVAKALEYISGGEFDKAKEAVETAKRVVNENQIYLGEDVFRHYCSVLGQLTEQITEQQNNRAEHLQQQRQKEAVEAQRLYRQRMETDRSKRIAELMDSAIAYQRQQRYDEALGQLESLLAIDPLNNQALILKQTLEDMIGFRRQLEVQKEVNKERIEILLETDVSGIPYDTELTHPKNWREIVAKRKPEEVIGQDLADVATYSQLEEIVDLSALTPEMSLSDAIVELRNSVEPPLKIVVLWRDLYDNADIDQFTPINMDSVPAIPLGTSLQLLLRSVSGGLVDLDYVVENGVVTVGTTGSLPSELQTLVYDVTVLLGRPADFYAQSGTGGGQGGGGGGRGGGGGGGGGGQGGGGGGGGGGQYFEEYIDIEEDEMDSQTLADQAAQRAESLRILIQETIEPDSWFDAGTGEGTVTFYENKKLVVRQTPEIHNKIKKLLKEMRKALGHQVAIEARFLMVGENFLEDIGLDIDFRIQAGGSWGPINFEQNSSDAVRPKSTGMIGSLGDDVADAYEFSDAITTEFGGSILNDLQANFVIRATQTHSDSKALVAPKVSVLSGEMASFRMQRTIRYPTPPDISYGGYGGYGGGGGIGGGGGYGGGMSSMQQNMNQVPTGTILNVTPTITPDRKHVLLNIVTELRDLLEMKDFQVEIPLGGGVGAPAAVQEYTVTLPQTQISRVRTLVNLPDGGTLLLGGQKTTAEVEKVSGVPILSKIPFIGRAFENRSKIKDNKVLLIMVKPTIILQEETDAEAIAAMENG